MENTFHYVYTLTSKSDESHHYTGLTKNLEARLKAHNAGQVSHTAKFRPWQIETVVAFRSNKKAIAFRKIPKISFRPGLCSQALLILVMAKLLAKPGKERKRL